MNPKLALTLATVACNVFVSRKAIAIAARHIGKAGKRELAKRTTRTAQVEPIESGYTTLEDLLNKNR